MTNSDQPNTKLLWSAENGQQELILHRDDVITIGRGDTNTIVICSSRVSRNHARIEWNGENFIIRDMGSSNGTFVNGQRVEYLPMELNAGDLIMLERVPMHFEVEKPQQSEQDLSSLPTVPKLQKIKKTSKPRLVITEGPESGREIVIDEEELTLGRESQTATWKVRLNDGTVSRPHARIENQNGQYFITDLGSANGTTLNDQLVIAPAALNDGDIIGIGATKLIFRL